MGILKSSSQEDSEIQKIEPVHYKQLVQECTIVPDQLT